MSHNYSRRDLLKSAACGFGYTALAGLMAERALAESAKGPLAPRPTHHKARAKRIIFLFMQGGVSHVDSFDHKPTLVRDDQKIIDVADARSIARPRHPPFASSVKTGWVGL